MPPFRFQTGSIKRKAYGIIGDTLNEGFDSKLVRLKATINEIEGVDRNFGFDSKLVRLKVHHVHATLAGLR